MWQKIDSMPQKYISSGVASQNLNEKNESEKKLEDFRHFQKMMTSSSGDDVINHAEIFIRDANSHFVQTGKISFWLDKYFKSYQKGLIDDNKRRVIRIEFPYQLSISTTYLNFLVWARPFCLDIFLLTLYIYALYNISLKRHNMRVIRDYCS